MKTARLANRMEPRRWVARASMREISRCGIAGLIITVIVSIYGSTISTLIPLDEYQRLSEEDRLFSFNTGLLMIATLHMTDKVVENMVLVMSPLLFAAWIGFALTSINLVPAWQLDGGHLARKRYGFASLVERAAARRMASALYQSRGCFTRLHLRLRRHWRLTARHRGSGN